MVPYIFIFLLRAVVARHVDYDPLLQQFWLGTRTKVSDEVCHTHVCKATADNILSSIDTKADPCRDFYSFACGGWVRQHPVPPTENSWSQFDILDRKLDVQIQEMLSEPMLDSEMDAVKAAKLTYQACMDTEKIEQRGVQPLIEVLNKLGGWPIITPFWNASQFNWQETVGKIINQLALGPVLSIYVDVDRKNTSRNVITVDQPSLVLPRYMLVDAQLGHIQPYISFITHSAFLLSNSLDSKPSILSIQSQAFEIIKFEMSLAKFTKKDEDRRDVNKMYNLATVEQLQKWTDNIPTNNRNIISWKQILNAFIGNLSRVTDRTEVIVMDMDYLLGVTKLLDRTSPRVLANYILWRVVKTLSRDLTSELAAVNFKFKSQLSAVKEDQPRWRECVMNAGYLTFAVGYMYISKHFSDTAKAEAVQMVENIRSAFKEELSDISWMDQQTKNAALKKVELMTHFIGYPDWYTNSSALNYFYRGVRISKEHFLNKVHLRGFLTRKVLEKLDKQTDRTEWTTTPAVVNAFYNPDLNSIIFPAGILHPPFFQRGGSTAVNYGSIGAIMGHEVTHGFDDMGRQSDELGNIQQWWSHDTEQTYLSLSQCFIDQYDSFRVPELDRLLNTEVTLNGVVTLGENIADNGGLRSALRAYKTQLQHKEQQLPGLESYTSEQLFYLGFANVWCETTTQESLLGEVLEDPHAPHRQRVVGTLSNTPEFAAAWQCPLGSPMNPQHKCQLW